MEFNARKVKWGIIFIAAGAMLLAHNYGLLSFELKFSRDWPAILIAIGLLGAWDGVFYRNRGGQRGDNPGAKKTIKEVLEKIERGEISAEEGARKIKE
ncbi:MAG: hypothetical protein FD189_1726 [Elusimicrobia bacterium]|nr:MAG: hypothetical protein FD154_1892 [Elusimicrobiota bacterium]KAF0154685.1 MAG: hypothetical protein FD189_1726 [Elusimicrobiota bacterium]